MPQYMITENDLRRALEQATVDLVEVGKYRITYDPYLQLFRVFDGNREHYAGDSINKTTREYNDLVTGR